jgi:folate-binding protein YgfZ
MSAIRFTRLDDRGIVAVTGPDAGHLLQGLITNDMARLDTEPAVHASLLTPQGKILFAFFVVRTGSDFALETTAAAAPDLAKRLGFYRLRAKAEIRDASATYCVLTLWPGHVAADITPPGAIHAYRDPRHPDLGARWLVRREAADTAIACLEAAGATQATAADYEAHRIACGVAEFGIDYAGAEVFPHEANFDRQAGVDFRKGCFVGQEVVARMQHKTVVRKRFVPVTSAVDLPADHPDITAGAATLGQLASVSGRHGLALVRLDRAVEQTEAGQNAIAGSAPVQIDPDAIATYRRAATTRNADPSP